MTDLRRNHVLDVHLLAADERAPRRLGALHVDPHVAPLGDVERNLRGGGGTLLRERRGFGSACREGAEHGRGRAGDTERGGSAHELAPLDLAAGKVLVEPFDWLTLAQDKPLDCARGQVFQPIRVIRILRIHVPLQTWGRMEEADRLRMWYRCLGVNQAGTEPKAVHRSWFRVQGSLVPGSGVRGSGSRLGPSSTISARNMNPEPWNTRTVNQEL
jgi:hypothetical protein